VGQWVEVFGGEVVGAAADRAPGLHVDRGSGTLLVRCPVAPLRFLAVVLATAGIAESAANEAGL
jgi:hypothetical protein